MTVALHLPVRASGKHNWQIVVRVNVRFTQAAAERHERMIEQRAVAIGRVLQLFQQIREHRDVKLVDLHQLLEPLGVPLVMRDGMVPIGDPDFAVCAVAAVAAEHERGDARHVRLPGDDLHVEHQLRVLLVVVGY